MRCYWYIKRMLSNKVIQMTSFGPGHLFGEVIIFSDVNKYPATVISSSKSEILFISRENFKQFTYTHPDFLEMFLRDLSNKILTLNKSIERLSYNSIRQKISNYIDACMNYKLNDEEKLYLMIHLVQIFTKK